jgi:cyclophilin family peptidyl-prolyl cis-trans isomerase
MRLSQSASRRSARAMSARVRSASAKACSVVLDALEPRCLFAGETVATAITPVLANTADPAANSITLNTHFNDTAIPGTVATFDTSYGQIEVALTDAATPNTVANFLNYVNSGAYDNTIFHRSAILNSSNTVVSPSNPGDIIQGGGYVVSGGSFNHIATNAPVDDEYTTELYGDVAGTLAMAKTSMANSATSEWYFNVHDNTSALDTPTTDSNGVTTSYTVFGTVIKGIDVVDEIAGLPTYNISSALATVPVTGLTSGEVKEKFPVTADNLVYTDKITTVPGTTYIVTSSDNSLVTPTISNGVLSFKYAAGKFGTANITVNATNLDGTTASSTFTVTVPNSTTPTAGPTSTAVTAPNIKTGTSGTFSVLDSATDSVAALSPSTVTIVTQPADGTASVNTSTGQITYTPNAGFTGTDTLTYTVSDTAGTTTTAQAVTINVVAAPISVTIGNSTARSLIYTDPDGSVAHLTIGSGAAVVTFAGPNVTVTKSNGIATATGTDASIASIVITNRGSAATFSLTSSGSVSVGSITDTGRLANINAPKTTITGTVSLGSTSQVSIAAATGATLSLGSGNGVNVILPTATNTNLSDTGSIARITSAQWLNTDGGFYGILTPKIGLLKVTGAFAEDLSLSSTGASLGTANVGASSGIWATAGSIGSTTLASPAATWSLSANGSIGRLTVVGNLGASNISAGKIGTLAVTGAANGSNINTTDAFSAAQYQINTLKVGGAFTQGTITATGSINNLTAASMDTNNISAGAVNTITVAGVTNALTLNTSATSVLNRNQIARLTFRKALTNSTITTAGKIGSISAASMATNSLTSLTLGSLNVAGATSAATITTNSTALNDGSLKFNGGLSSSTITAQGTVSTIATSSITTDTFTVASIGTLNVTGATSAATITTNSSALTDDNLHFKGSVSNSTLAASGDVRTISAASMAGNTFTLAALGTLNIASTVSETTLTSTVSTSRIGLIHIGGAASSTKIAAAGAIGSVSAASFSGSQIYAGVNASVTAVPELAASLSDLAADVHIGSVTVGKGATAFSNTLISAYSIGSLNLGQVASSNSGTGFGVSTHLFTGTVKAMLVPGGTIDASRSQLKTAATLAAYEKAKNISLGNFEINLI